MRSVDKLVNLNTTTLTIAGIERPLGMHSLIFLGNQVVSPRRYAFSARDRIDETANRI